MKIKFRLSRITIFVALLPVLGVLPARAATPFFYASSQAEKAVAPRARGVMAALRNRHMNRLARFVHPQNGLRFSPYVFVSRGDRLFSRTQIRRLGNRGTLYFWGGYDGTGDPIHLTWREYFEQFIYNRDFAHASKITYNVVGGRGNTTNNLREFYPGSIAVRYYSPDPKVPDGHDWYGLWLVFQPRGKVWYLAGIAHNQWTI